MTVLEVAIGAAVTMVAVAIMLSALMGTQRVDAYTADQAEALRALQHASDRLTGELRQARRIYADSTSRSVRFWVDRDHDNLEAPGERITWEIATVDGRSRLQRRTDAAAAPDRVEVGFAVQDAFAYFPSVSQATRVAISLEANTRSDGSDRSARHIETEVTLRNVAE